MGHHHHHHSPLHHHHHGHGDSSNIKVAFFLNLSFTIVEVVGGIFTNSLAILSDALHDLGDSLTLGLAWYFQNLSKKGRDQSFSYGYRRFSLLGAIINSVVLIVGSIFILVEAVPRVLHPEEVNAEGMIWLAILGIIVNGAAVLRLKKGTSINERVVSLHLLEDVLGWVAVLIASIIMLFFDVPLLDPILSMCIAAYILFNAYRGIKESFSIILQGVPKHISVKSLEQQLLRIEGVQEVHDLHIWTMDGEYNIVSVHLVVSDDSTKQQIAEIRKIARNLLENEQIEHVTIEVHTRSEASQLAKC
ncbi:MAG: cation diffusion facilitator family transporter [Flammeovirgaceae bacterium]